MDPGRSLSKLTEREKECLRAWLDHKTAKEIALDLGISHYAVEKRLKMTRVKLDVASSIDAARLLADAEGYKQSGPQPADLDLRPDPGDKPASRSTTIGVLAMSLVLATAVVLLTQATSGEVAPAAVPAPSSADYRTDDNGTIKFGLGDLGNVEASPERARQYVQQMFEREDTDSSGYIDLAEAPDRIEIGKPRPDGSLPKTYAETEIAEVLEGDAARTEYIRGGDKDGDDRISFEEYALQRVPYYEQRGIPLIPADWAGCC